MPEHTLITDNCEQCGASPLRLEHEMEQRTQTRVDDEGVGGEQTGMWGMPIGICLSCGHRNRMMDRPDAAEKARPVQFDVGALYAAVAGARWAATEGSTIDEWDALDNLSRLRHMVAEVDQIEPVLRPLLMHTFYWMEKVLVANPVYQIHPIQIALIDDHLLNDINMIDATVTQSSILIRTALAEAEEADRS